MSAYSQETLQQEITTHKFITDHYLGSAIVLASPEGFNKVVKSQAEVLAEHLEQPIDLLVGDDVSGRVPTLITNRFLRLAHAAGHIESVPRTIFMSSGTTRELMSPDELNEEYEKWDKNLSEYAHRLLGNNAVNRALIVTELVGSGRSVKRLEDALSDGGVIRIGHLVVPALYLRGSDSKMEDRRIVGVEKHSPKSTSHKHPGFNAKDSADLRLFLNTYTESIYATVFNEEAPDLTNYQPTYTAKLQPVPRPKPKFMERLRNKRHLSWFMSRADT